MPCELIFGAQIESNMLENHADQREMVLLFSLLFFTLLQQTRQSGVIFLQRLISFPLLAITTSIISTKALITPIVTCYCYTQRTYM